MERIFQNPLRAGIFLALGTALISGVSVYLNKFAVTAVPDAVLFTTLKNTLVGAAFLVVLVMMLRTKSSMGVGAMTRRDILEAYRAAACADALRTVPAEFVPPPMSGVARGLLTDIALELGGVGAYERLADAPGPIAARLAAAARVPTDSLVRAWRARAFAGAPRPITLRRAGAWAAMAWAVTFAFLGLRSTRWR